MTAKGNRLRAVPPLLVGKTGLEYRLRQPHNRALIRHRVLPLKPQRCERYKSNVPTQRSEPFLALLPSSRTLAGASKRL